MASKIDSMFIQPYRTEADLFDFKMNLKIKMIIKSTWTQDLILNRPEIPDRNGEDDPNKVLSKI